MEQSRIPEFDGKVDNGNQDIDWSFHGADTKYLTHGLHQYPARMIPQIAKQLIRDFSEKGEVVWDPFCGSGTSLVESMLLERISIGTDLNPFAVFLSRVKTAPIMKKKLDKSVSKLIHQINSDYPEPDGGYPIPEMPNIKYWFKPYIQKDLARIRYIIDQIDEESVHNFFLLCIAKTARDVSNLKKNEFKIVRMKEPKLSAFEPDVNATFIQILKKNKALLNDFAKALPPEATAPRIYEVDNRESPIEDGSVDLVVTSPPYGDHGTTVAYGQFSRYPALWIGLDLEDVKSIDRRGLGGKSTLEFDPNELKSKTLQKTYTAVCKGSEKRGKQLYNFIHDFSGSLKAMHDKLKDGGHACIVVGNRLMSRVRIPTNVIIVELGNDIGFEHVRTIGRDIPTKRMPWQTAPENVTGDTADTMHKENIIILRKKA